MYYKYNGGKSRLIEIVRYRRDKRLGRETRKKSKRKDQ